MSQYGQNQGLLPIALGACCTGAYLYRKRCVNKKNTGPIAENWKEFGYDFGNPSAPHFSGKLILWFWSSYISEMLLESLFSWIHSNFLQSILILLWKIYSVTVLLWFPEHISLLYNLVWQKKIPTFKLYLCVILSCLWFFSFLPQEQSWETSSLVVGHGHTRNS